VGEEPKILEHDADTAAEAGEEAAFGGLYVGAEDGQAAAGGADGEVHQAEKTGLAGAGWAEQPAERAVRQGETEIVQDFRSGLGRRALAGSAVSQSDSVESHHANARFGRSAFLPLCGARRKRRAALPRTKLSRNIGKPMRITCPSCSTGYEVPDSLMPAGRIVRCAKCGEEWTPTATPAGAAEVEARPEERVLPAAGQTATWSVARQSAMDRLAAHPAQTPSRLPLRLAWAASVLVLVVAVWAAFAWRADIAAAWPPSGRVYALFGLQAAAK
jgi:predicted Zn finger-like uncharacterized protein